MGEMTNLRYIIPLIVEANKRDISSVVYVFWNVNQKYSAPHRNKDALIRLSEKYNFTLKDIIHDWKDVRNTHLTFFYGRDYAQNSGRSFCYKKFSRSDICVYCYYGRFQRSF